MIMVKKIMDTKQLVDYLLSFNGAQECYPFGPDTQVFKVMDKMYALIGYRNGKDYINLKAKPQDVLSLTDQYQAITPGYHMNKAHWISVEINNPEVDALTKELVEHSYLLIVSSLPKKKQALLSDN